MAANQLRNLTHGVVRRQAEQQILAMDVQQLRENNPNQWTLTLNPQQIDNRRDSFTPYTAGEEIMYEDGNNNNTTFLIVVQVMGPGQYRLEGRP